MLGWLLKAANLKINLLGIMMISRQSKADPTNQISSQAPYQTIAQFIDAGIGLAMLPFALVQKTFMFTKEETSNTLASLQTRGEQVDEKLRDSIATIEQISPLKLCNKVFGAISNKPSKDEKIEQLSSKVDTLVELVATLAAKKAAEKNALSASKVADTEPKKRAPRVSATTTANKPAPKPRARRTTKAAVKKDSE